MLWFVERILLADKSYDCVKKEKQMTYSLHNFFHDTEVTFFKLQKKGLFVNYSIDDLYFQSSAKGVLFNARLVGTCG